MIGSSSLYQLHGMLHEIVQHGEAVAHAARAAGQVHDERAAAYAGHAARERSAMEAWIDAEAHGFGDARRLALEHVKVGTRFDVDCRGERIPAEVVNRPFWTEGSAKKGA